MCSYSSCLVSITERSSTGIFTPVKWVHVCRRSWAAIADGLYIHLAFSHVQDLVGFLYGVTIAITITVTFTATAALRIRVPFMVRSSFRNSECDFHVEQTGFFRLFS